MKAQVTSYSDNGKTSYYLTVTNSKGEVMVYPLTRDEYNKFVNHQGEN